MSQIKVLITDETGKTESVNTNTTLVNNKTGKIKDESVQQNDSYSKNLAVASMVASQVFNYTTSNVGKWMGSTRTQTTINNTMQLVGIGAMAYVNPYVTIATIGISIGTTALDTAYEQIWDAKQKNYNRLRVGELKGRGRQ